MVEHDVYSYDEGLGGEESILHENDMTGFNGISTDIRDDLDTSDLDKDLSEDPDQTITKFIEERSDEEVNDRDELEAIKERVLEMEKEAEKLKLMQDEVEQQMNLSSTATSPVHLSAEERLDADRRSIYIGNVDYGATAQELEAHFHGCGSVNRVTILCDHYTGHPKGYSYIEFADKESIDTSVALDGSLFRGRQIKVIAKRTNRPGISTTDRPPRGRGYRGRGRGNPYASTRGRGRGSYRSRRGYSPY